MKHILLIDDDEDMLAMTGRWLEKAGYDVTKATGGREALDILNSISPDLILLDHAMPEMDGPAVLKEIKASDRLKNIPVLYRTGMDDEIADDADGIVPKSEGKPYLLNAIAKIFD